MTLTDPIELAIAMAGTAADRWHALGPSALGDLLIAAAYALLLTCVLVIRDNAHQQELEQARETAGQIAHWADELEERMDNIRDQVAHGADLIEKGFVEDGLRDLDAAIDLADGHDEAALTDARWRSRGVAA